jgi:hypothetical protein
MPLNLSPLASELEGVFSSEPPNGSVAAQRIAQAYDNYCKAGLAGGIPPVFTGTEAKRLEGPLANALNSKSSAASVASAFASGLTAYWLQPPVIFAAPPVLGAATVIPGAQPMVNPLTGVLKNLSNGRPVAANKIAAELDKATKTVLVTFTAPQPTPPSPATVV